MRLLQVISLFLIVFSAHVNAADYNMFDHVGYSAESIGKGGIALFDSHAHSVFNNPSAADFKYISASSFYTSLVDNENKIYALAGGVRLGKARLLAGVTQSTIGGNYVTQRHPVTNVIEDVSSFEYANRLAQLGIGWKISQRLSVGFTGNYYFNDLHTVNGTGYNGNIGALFTPVKSLKMAAYAKNVLPLDLSYSNGQTENLPLELYFGFEKKLYSQFELSAQFSMLGTGKDSKNLKAAALKYFIPLTKHHFYVVAGYQEFVPLVERKRKLTLGVGLEIIALNVYFSYAKSDYQDNNFFTSFTLNL